MTGKVLYRRGVSEPMLTPVLSDRGTAHFSSGRFTDAGRRRNFGETDKRLIVGGRPAEPLQPFREWRRSTGSGWLDPRKDGRAHNL